MLYDIVYRDDQTVARESSSSNFVVVVEDDRFGGQESVVNLPGRPDGDRTPNMDVRPDGVRQHPFPRWRKLLFTV